MSLKKGAKKLLLVLATSTPVTAARKKTFGNIEITENGKNSKNKNKSKNLKTNLIQVPYIQYFIIFQEQFVSILFDSRNEVNTIHLIFAKKLGLSIRLTNVGVQKIDINILNTYRIVV